MNDVLMNNPMNNNPMNNNQFFIDRPKRAQKI